MLDEKRTVNRFTIKIGHIEGEYCDLQAELELIIDDLEAYYIEQEKSNVIYLEKKRQKVLEQRLRIFPKEFSDRTDKLQVNIAWRILPH